MERIGNSYHFGLVGDDPSLRVQVDELFQNGYVPQILVVAIMTMQTSMRLGSKSWVHIMMARSLGEHTATNWLKQIISETQSLRYRHIITHTNPRSSDAIASTTIERGRADYDCRRRMTCDSTELSGSE